MTADEQARALSEALLAPVAAIGRLLAEELDELRAEVNALRQHVDGLQGRVDAIEKGGGS